MAAQLTVEELQKMLDEIAAKYPGLRRLEEWKRLRALLHRRRRAGASPLTLDVLDAAEEFDAAVLYYYASVGAGGVVPASYRC